MSAQQSFETQRLVLREHPAARAIAAYAAECGWPLIAEVSGGAPGRGVAWRIDHNLALQYAEDAAAMASFVFVRSAAPGQASALLDTLRPALDPWSLTELIAEGLAARDSVGRDRALARIVLAAPLRACDEVLRCLRNLCYDESAEVRIAAIGAIGHLLWPEGRPLLAEIADQDPQRAVRKCAKAALRDLDRLGVTDA